MNLFDIFTRQEESIVLDRDINGRFCYSSSSQKTIDKAIVSNHLKKTNSFNHLFPNNHPFAACITHDIDDLFEDRKLLYINFLKDIAKLRFSSAQYKLKCIIDKKNSNYFNLKKLIDLERSYGANATYFLP